MARRNPGISPILSARGYGARVLWPKYTPDGGINSGSEVPTGPSNTLQSNNSNLIASYSNPVGGNLHPSLLKPANVALARKTINDVLLRKAEPDQKFFASVQALAFRAKHLPGAMISEAERKSLRGAHRVMQDAAPPLLNEAVAQLKLTDMPKLRSSYGTAHLLKNPFGYEIEPGIEFIPTYTDSALDNPFSGPHQEAFHHMAMRSNPGEKFEVRTKRGKTMSMTRAQVEKMGSKMLAPGEVERVLGRENPKKRYVATTYGGHGYMGGGEDDIGISTGHNVYKASSTKKAHKMAARFGAQEAPQKLRSGERAYKVTSKYGDGVRMDFLDTGRPSKMKRMAKKSDGLYSRRAVELRPGESMHEWMNPRHNPDPDGRLSPQELAAMKVQAVAMLDKKVPHAEVRKQLNLTYPKYMAVLRSGTTKRGAPTHVPDSPSHFLRMPVQDRKDKRKQAVSMLKAGTKHEDVRKSLGVGYKTYLGILRTIPNPHLYDGYHEMMSNPAVLRMNPFGG